MIAGDTFRLGGGLLGSDAGPLPGGRRRDVPSDYRAFRALGDDIDVCIMQGADDHVGGAWVQWDRARRRCWTSCISARWRSGSMCAFAATSSSTTAISHRFGHRSCERGSDRRGGWGEQSSSGAVRRGSSSRELDARPARFVWLGTTRPLDAFTFCICGRIRIRGSFQAHCYRFEPGLSTCSSSNATRSRGATRGSIRADTDADHRSSASRCSRRG